MSSKHCGDQSGDQAWDAEANRHSSSRNLLSRLTETDVSRYRRTARQTERDRCAAETRGGAGCWPGPVSRSCEWYCRDPAARLWSVAHQLAAAFAAWSRHALLRQPPVLWLSARDSTETVQTAVAEVDVRCEGAGDWQQLRLTLDPHDGEVFQYGEVPDATAAQMASLREHLAARDLDLGGARNNSFATHLPLATDQDYFQTLVYLVLRLWPDASRLVVDLALGMPAGRGEPIKLPPGAVTCWLDRDRPWLQGANAVEWQPSLGRARLHLRV